MTLKIKDLFTIFTLSIGIFLFVIDLFIINVSLPTIQNTLYLNNGQTQWIIILYVIGYASLLINAGKAGNYFGHKKLYIFGMIGFTIASAICGFSENIYVLLLGRLLQGFSSGLMVPQGLTLITRLFEKPEQRTIAFGIYGSIAGLASVIGQFLGGLIPDLHWMNESWRLIFLINIPFGLIAIVVSYIMLPKDQLLSKEKLSYFPLIQIFVLLIGLIYPLIIGPELHWPLWTIVLLIVFILLTFWFLKHQKGLNPLNSSAIINFSLFRSKMFNLGLLAALFYYMVQDAYFIMNSNYLQNHKNFTATMTGIAFVYQGIGYFIASLVASKFVQKKGKIIVLSGLSIMIIGLFFHLYFLNHEPLDETKIHILFFFYGIGCGSVLPSLMTLALKDLSKELIGVGSAIYLTVQQISICLGIAVVVGIYLQTKGNSFYFFNQLSTAYGLAVSISVVFLLIVMLFILKIFSRRDEQ